MSNIEIDGDAVIEMDLLPPRWLDIEDEVSQLLQDIAIKMKRLEQLHAKHVLPGFDDESVKAKEERDIESLTNDITKDFNSCQRAIKRIDKMVHDQRQTSPDNQVSSADEAMAKNLKISLATRVGDTSTLFRKKQAAYLKKLRSLGGMSSGISSPFGDGRASTPQQHAQNPYTDPAMLDSESDRTSAQSTLLQTAQVRRRTPGVMDAAIAQREREIERIAQGVIDLSNLFQDLQTMVIDQGTVLDRVDYNVERAVEQVRGAEKELKIATGYQRRSTKRKLIFLLLLIVVGMIILLAVKPKRGSGGGQSSAPAPAPAPPAEGDVSPTVADEFDGIVERAEVGEYSAQPGELLSRRHIEWKQRRRRSRRSDGNMSLMVA